MNKIKKIIVSLIVLMTFFILGTKEVSAYGDLDRIESYVVVVNPREDGTLDMEFTYNWRVLDSKSEGPLEWVLIGIPNLYVDELIGLTNNIKSIKYSADGGSFIKIVFNKKYYKDDLCVFKFKLHLSRMYFLDGDTVKYHYSPGYFEEIKVDKATVLWNANNVISANTNDLLNGYYKWEFYNLNYEETIELKLLYNKDSFVGLSKDLQFSDAYLTLKDKLVIVGIILGVVAIFVTIILISYYTQDPYYGNRGFVYIPRRRYFFYHHHYSEPGRDSKGAKFVNPNAGGHGGTGGFGGGGSCACACACAGGGRAGCSLKGFYHKQISKEMLLKHLSK